MYYIAALMITILDIILILPVLITGGLLMVQWSLSEWKSNLKDIQEQYDAEASEQNEQD